VSATKRYRGAGIEVTFDTARCLHAAECVRGLPAVFDTARRPWIDPDRAAPDAVAAVVWRCPSGALHVSAAEEPDRPTRIDAPADGPLFVRGDLRIETAEGELTETRAALCRCGASVNRPFCDGSGDCSGWLR
jgi:uncharacterized Fe-S cluster protein YjdI